MSEHDAWKPGDPLKEIPESIFAEEELLKLVGTASVLTDEPILDLAIRVGNLRTPTGPIAPRTVRKAPFEFLAPEGDGETVEDEVEIELHLERGDATLHRRKLALSVTSADQVHKRTFLSAVDGSVQYYGVRPARPLPGDRSQPALFLSLHGASVEARGQAASYSAKAGRVDSGDLLTALMEGEVAGLGSLAEPELPEALQAVPKAKRKKWLKTKRKERKAMESEALSLSKKREEWLADEEARKGGPKDDAFDTNVVDMLREQAASVGVAY